MSPDSSPFWPDVPTFEGRALDLGASSEEALFHVLCKSRATFTGLRLRDGGLIIKVARGRKAEQIRVTDGEAFDPARSGLEVLQHSLLGPHSPLGPALSIWTRPKYRRRKSRPKEEETQYDSNSLRLILA